MSDIAREIGVSRRTVKRWSNRSTWCERSRSTPACQREQIVARRRIVAKLVETCKTVSRTRYTPVRRKPVTRRVRIYPFSTPSAISRELRAHHGICCSPSTVRLDLCALSYAARRRGKGPYLTEDDEKKRVVFAKEMLRLKPKLLFSDECHFTTNEYGGNAAWQWVKRGQEPERLKNQQEAAAVSVWACIGEGFKELIVLPAATGRISAKKYRESILQKVASKLRNESKRGHEFMQDNAPCHRGSQKYLSTRRVRVLKSWPARSCDLNPLESLWSLLKRRVSSKAPFGEEMLSDFIKSEWNSLPQSLIDKYVRSFPVRCKRVVQSKGKTVGSRRG